MSNLKACNSKNVVCTSSEVSCKYLERFSYEITIVEFQRGIMGVTGVTVLKFWTLSDGALYFYGVSGKYLQGFSNYRADTK